MLGDAGGGREGRPAAEGQGETGEAGATPPAAQAGIMLKVTSAQHAEVWFRIKRTTRLSKLMRVYCEKSNQEPASVVFLFDGERIRPDQTPADFDMEDKDEIDVMPYLAPGPPREWHLPLQLTERILEVVLEAGTTQAVRDVANAACTCRSMAAAARVLGRRVVWTVEVLRTERHFDDTSRNGSFIDIEQWIFGDHYGEPLGSGFSETESRLVALCTTREGARAEAARVFVRQLVVDGSEANNPVDRANVDGWPDAAYLAKGPPFDSRDMPEEARVRFDRLGYSRDEFNVEVDFMQEQVFEQSHWWEGPGRDRVCVHIAPQVVKNAARDPPAKQALAVFKCAPPTLADLGVGPLA